MRVTILITTDEDKRTTNELLEAAKTEPNLLRMDWKGIDPPDAIYISASGNLSMRITGS